jgi:hypothetical protein
VRVFDPTGRGCAFLGVVHVTYIRGMPTSLLPLIPGQTTTTRSEVKESYGGSEQGGIVPSKQSQRVFIYSDLKAGEEHGYTFDGRAEDDEFGPLYLYTGAGAIGHQTLPGANQALLFHEQQGREAHLFIADGYKPGSGAALQRYIGQVVVDQLQPFEECWNEGADGVLRRVFVFRLRQAPGAPPLVFLPKDGIAPAKATSVIPVTPIAQPVPQLLAPQVPGGGLVNIETHGTAITTASIKGGPQTVTRRESLLTQAFENFLAAHHHTVKRFQLVIEGESGALLTDTYDVTDNVLYEAKSASERNHVRMAIGQLMDYSRHAQKHVAAKLRLAILLPGDPGEDLRDLITGLGIALVFQDGEGFAGFPLSADGVSGTTSAGESSYSV